MPRCSCTCRRASRGLLSGVKLCPEAQANEGTCGPEQPDRRNDGLAPASAPTPCPSRAARSTSPKNTHGAPFGLSIVNPVKAGPFDLEHDTVKPRTQDPPCDCVVVRAKIEVDPTTAALTVTTDPKRTARDPAPDRRHPRPDQEGQRPDQPEHFTFNPTNCNPMSMTGSIAERRRRLRARVGAVPGRPTARS